MALSETESRHNPPTLKTLPFCLGAVAFLLVLLAFPLTRHWIWSVDVWSTYKLNGLLGHSRHIDLLVAWLNGKVGDTAIVVCLSIMGIAHILIPWNRSGVSRKLAFWGWVGLAFCIVYLFQQIAESAFSRESPGRVLEGWFNLTEHYDVKTRVRSKNSFPSGHASAYFFYAIMALRRYPRIGFLVLALAVFMPVTRIMTGGHWVSDTYLGSLPIAALAAGIAYETPLFRVNRWLEVLVDTCWGFVVDFWKSRSNP